MKVWVVMAGYIDDWDCEMGYIEGIFDTFEKSERRALEVEKENGYDYKRYGQHNWRSLSYFIDIQERQVEE